MSGNDDKPVTIKRVVAERRIKPASGKEPPLPETPFRYSENVPQNVVSLNAFKRHGRPNPKPNAPPKPR